ncbi:MAG: glucosyltransferase domain-containing protein [Lachnospiraceae bacterium]
MKFKDYLHKKEYLWITIFLFAVISHGSMLLSNSIGIDTEDIISSQQSFYHGWLITERQGLVLLKTIFKTQSFNPYFAGAMTLLFSTTACILWTYLFSYITKKENNCATFVFSALLLSSPILTEQYYFKLQSMEIAIDFCIMAVSLYLIFRTFEASSFKLKLLYAASATLLNLILFSSYQAMPPLFLFGCGVCFLLYYIFDETGFSTAKEIWSFIASYALIFFASFLLNTGITKMFFSGSPYLAKQVRWFSCSIKDCLENIYDNLSAMILGKNFYYTKSLAIFSVITLACIFLFFLSHKEKKYKLLCILGCFFTLLSPFFMTFLCGGTTPIRSQLVLPFLLAFLAYDLLLFLADRQNLTVVLLLLCLVTGYQQLKNTMMLNYSDQVRYESDVRIATSMIGDINKLQDADHSYPVFFFGLHAAELNPSCVMGESIGHSIFTYDIDVKPKGYYNTKRILGFMNTLGVQYKQGTKQQTRLAAAYSKEMPSWPQEGSITLQNNMIIVKLSDFS